MTEPTPRYVVREGAEFGNWPGYWAVWATRSERLVELSDNGPYWTWERAKADARAARLNEQEQRRKPNK